MERRKPLGKAENRLVSVTRAACATGTTNGRRPCGASAGDSGPCEIGANNWDRQGQLRSDCRGRGPLGSNRSRLGWLWPGARATWLREQDLNLRPSGYEPDELPGCSIPRHEFAPTIGARNWLMTCKWVFQRVARTTKPGGDLLFQRLSGSTIGAAWFHGRVRDGIGWVTGAMATELSGPCNPWGFSMPC